MLAEENTYRIDHYLGKELIENLTVLRFSNIIFSPLWSRQYIRNVQINFSENFRTEVAVGISTSTASFATSSKSSSPDHGVVCDGGARSLDAEDIRDEKVKVIKCIHPIDMDNVVLGQYKVVRMATGSFGYLDDDTVPPGSRCPTFAAMALFIDNAGGDGVPSHQGWKGVA